MFAEKHPWHPENTREADETIVQDMEADEESDDGRGTTCSVLYQSSTTDPKKSLSPLKRARQPSAYSNSRMSSYVHLPKRVCSPRSQFEVNES
jgi:hypothetical protein